VHMQLPISH